MTSLAEAQARFHALVTGADAPCAAEDLVLASDALSPAARVAIYASMWRTRQVEALREDFPAVSGLVGAQAFDAMARAYLERHPSDHFDLGRLGRRLPGWLRPRPAGRPDLADLAALEWARVDVFLEADGRPASRATLAAMAPETLSAARLALVPASRLLRLRHAVAPLWRALREKASPPPPAAGPSAVLVWRCGFEVFHAEIPPDEARALSRLRRGAPLGSALAALAGGGSAAEAAAALLRWLDEELLAVAR